MKTMNKLKLSIYENNRVVVENYDELREITDNEIIVDEYKILGDFLKIRRMDDYIVEIVGLFTTIIVMNR